MRARMQSTRHRILVVDDERIVLKLLEMTFRDHDVESATTVAEATGLLDELTFDGVVTDKNLPDGSGQDIARHARARHPDAAIILLTAYTSAESAEEAMSVDIDGYVAKPFDVDELRDGLLEAIGRRTAVAKARGRPAPSQRPAASSPAASASTPPPRTSSSSEALPRILLFDPVEEDRAQLNRLLGEAGFLVESSGEPLSVLKGALPLAGAVLHRSACNEEVKQEVWRRRMDRPSFRLVTILDSRALDETVASILIGATGQLVRPLDDDVVRRTINSALEAAKG